ncbi:MAG: gluconate 2-dehydrogenase subunit 3 family protein [Pseudomonadales bacterium]|nr:gluconate 2-dehydrogenase subunit 3 family protein [Pseudomonadales bacterium]MEC9239464.1 gluconate 2-dehydrogenase subunit 3 family protein [Pseudomonadota bacterium]
MSSNEIIGSDAVLDSDQQRTFGAILDMIIPASGDGRFPSAAETDVLGYVAKTDPKLLETVRIELDRLNTMSENLHGLVFGDAHETVRQELLDEIRGKEPQFLRGLALQTVTCYYQDDRVMEAIGMEARPPFPKGYEVVAGDLSLLDPVRARGQVYRDVEV